ncbi:MAG: SpoIIE family protein phosphatase, partial [Candidatus Competibacter sp.]|nr:SpoIIE family protein phosphatase [Candidatus Competibacter sp.]
MLLRTRVIMLVLLSFVLVIAGMLVTGLWNERLVAELRDGDILRGQETLWRELTQARLRIMRAALARIARDSPLTGAVAGENRAALADIATGYLTMLQAEGAVSRIEILGRDGEALYNSGSELFWSASISADQIDAVLRHGETVSGLANNANRRLVALVAAPITVENPPESARRAVGVAILSFDVMPNLDAMWQNTGAAVLLVNRRGRLIQGTDPQLWEQIQRSGSLSRQREMQVVAVADRMFAVTRIPVPGISQSRIADLITLRDVTTGYQRQRAIRLTTLAIMAGVLGVILLALFHYLRNAFRPLNQAVAVLDALARGDTLRTIEGATRADEIGNIAQAVEVFREHMIALDSMKRAREQQRRRQQRFIRQEMTRLAETLEPGARSAVLEDLTEIEAESRRAIDSGAVSENLGMLATAFGHMATRVREQHQQLDGLIRELREALKTKTQYIALQQELDIAREIQRAMLPKAFPARAEVEIFGAMIPAKEIGGDFYDFFVLDEHRVGVAIADVSGKGVPAALFMAIAKTLLRATALFRAAPGACLAKLNDLLCENNDQELFVTV